MALPDVAVDSGSRLNEDPEVAATAVATRHDLRRQPRRGEGGGVCRLDFPQSLRETERLPGMGCVLLVEATG
jgi:hypothetical protein